MGRLLLASCREAVVCLTDWSVPLAVGGRDQAEPMAPVLRRGPRVTRRNLKYKLATYESAQNRLTAQREQLREAVIEWREEGATIVEIAQTLGWSRQAVYDLIGKS